MRDAVRRDRRKKKKKKKFFTPQRTTSKTAAGDRGKLVEGFSRVSKPMEMKELMILMVVVANFLGVGFFGQVAMEGEVHRGGFGFLL